MPSRMKRLWNLERRVTKICYQGTHRIALTETTRHPHITEAKLPDVGSKQQVYISYVRDASRLYIHLRDSPITEITQQASSLCKCDPPPEKELHPGAYVGARSEEDGIWYRAQVLSLTPGASNSKIEVYYLDFGNAETLPVSALCRLPSTLFKWPVQAIRCALDCVYPLREKSLWEQATELLQGTMEEEVHITVKGHRDGVCLVDLITGDGSVNENLVSQKLVSSVPKVVEPDCLQLPSENEWDVVVLSVEAANRVILRLIGEKYSERLVDLEEKIASNQMHSNYVPEVGDLCAAIIPTPTTDDNPWYRMRIQSLEEGKAICEYVDYSDTEVVPVDRLRPLTPAEAALPFQAVVAYLTGLEGCEGNKEVEDQLSEMVFNKQFVAVVDSRDGDPSVTLFDTSTDEDIKINEMVADVILDFKPSLPKEETLCEGYVSNIDMDGTLHIQLQGPGLVKLESLTQRVSDIYNEKRNDYLVQDVQIGRLVMALYSEDGWYRAVIKQNLPNCEVLVYFVDYGNAEVVSTDLLRELESVSKTLYNLPYQELIVRLEGLPPPGFTWTPTAVDQLGEYAPPDCPVYFRTVSSQDSKAEDSLSDCDGLPTVHLSKFVDCDFFSINTAMLNPLLWTASQGSIGEWAEVLPRLDDGGLTPDSGAKPELSLRSPGSDADPLSDASVASQQTSELLLATERLILESGLELDDAATGDGLFKPQTAVSQVTDLRNLMASSLAADLSNSPVSTAEDTEEVPIVTNIADANIKTLVCSTSSSDSTGQPALESDRDKGSEEEDDHETKDCNSNDKLKLSPEHSTDFSKLPSTPLAEPPNSGEEVFVTWVADPVFFRFVVHSRLQVIDDMMNRMADFYYNEGDSLTVSHVETGALYAGLHSEDDRWYRLRITNIINQPILGSTTMVSANFVDYGCLNLMSVTSLRQLTAEFRQLPLQALKASLAGVAPEAGVWSEEAVARFEELVYERRLVAMVHSQGADGDLDVTLVEPNAADSSERFIHKKLIAEGLAITLPMVR